MHFVDSEADIQCKLKIPISAMKMRMLLKERKMKHNVPEFQTFNWFIPCVFWLNLLDHMNANFEDRNQRIKMEEIQLFIYIALFLGVYNLFSTWLFEGFNPRK